MAEEVEPAVRITLKDVWVEQREMKEQLTRLVEQLPSQAAQSADDIADVRAVNDDHEQRLRRLEERANKASWVPVLVGSVLSIIGTAGLGALILNFIVTK